MGDEKQRKLMKKFKFIAFALFSLCLCLNLSSCSKDDEEPNKKSFYGIWEDVANPDDYPLLITKDCVIMWNGDYEEVYGEGNKDSFVPFLNASYETLAYTFAPDDEFFIYRHDKNTNQYILYMGYAMDIREISYIS